MCYSVQVNTWLRSVLRLQMKADRKGQRRTKNPDEEINGRERKKTQGEMRTHGLAVFCSTQGHTLKKETHLGHPIIHILQ